MPATAVIFVVARLRMYSDGFPWTSPATKGRPQKCDHDDHSAECTDSSMLPALHPRTRATREDEQRELHEDGPKRNGTIPAVLQAEFHDFVAR